MSRVQTLSDDDVEWYEDSASPCVPLIVRIREFLKKPQIEHDLSAILRTFNDNVLTANIPANQINFAHAALLLESAAGLYTKKVDLFEKDVHEYLRRHQSYEENDSILVETRLKCTKKRRTRKFDEPPAAPIRHSVDEANVRLLGMSFDEFDRFLPRGASQTNADEREAFPSSYETNWLERCKKKTSSMVEVGFRCGSTLPASNSREFELMQHVHSKIMRDKVAPLVHNLHELNRHEEIDVLADYTEFSAFDIINRAFNDEYRQVHKNHVLDAQIERRNSHDFIVQQLLLGKDVNIDEIYAKWEDFMRECREIDGNRCKMKDGSVDASFDEMQASQESGVDVEMPSMMKMRNLRSRTTMDSDLDSGISLCTHSDCFHDDLTCIVTPQTLAEVQGRQGLKRQRCTPKRLLDGICDFDDEGDEGGERPVRKRTRRERPRPVATVSLKEFNEFFDKNYVPSEGEAFAPPFDPYLDDDDSPLPECAIAASTPSPEDKEATYPSPPPPLEPSFAEIMGNDACTRLQRVMEWQTFISEKIGQQNETDFDVHEEESKIIDLFGEVGGCTMKYERIVHGKSAASATRLFSAMLHLANAGNVELGGVQRGGLSNSTLELQLLSKDRYNKQTESVRESSTKKCRKRVSSLKKDIKKLRVS